MSSFQLEARKITKIDVIIVDDDKDDRFLACHYLKKNPAFGKIVEFSSGQEFLNAIEDDLSKSSNFVVVLLDVNMPGMSGLDTVKKFEELDAVSDMPHSCAIIVHTSSSNPQEKKRFLSFSDVVGYIEKPLGNKGADNILGLFRFSQN